MQLSNDRVEDGFVNGADKYSPPRMKLIRPSGDVEVLKPVAAVPNNVQDNTADSDVNSSDPLSHRALAIGAGAVVALLAFAVLSGIFFGIQDSGPGTSVPDVVQAEQPSEKTVRAPKEPGPIEAFPAKIEPAVDAVSAPNSEPAIDASPEPRPAAAASAYRTVRRHSLPRPKMISTGFIPTTLVIYSESGLVKSRVAPQVAPFTKRPKTFSN